MSQSQGLYRLVHEDGAIKHAAWLRARAEHQQVGTCPRCNDYLIPAPPYEHAGRTDYQADCRNSECGYSLVAPGGRVREPHTIRGTR